MLLMYKSKYIYWTIRHYVTAGNCKIGTQFANKTFIYIYKYITFIYVYTHKRKPKLTLYAYFERFVHSRTDNKVLFVHWWSTNKHSGKLNKTFFFFLLCISFICIQILLVYVCFMCMQLCLMPSFWVLFL